MKNNRSEEQLNKEAVLNEEFLKYHSNTEKPSFLWRAASFQTLLGVATLCRGFLYGLNKVEVTGLPGFLDLLKSRADPAARKRGLLTVSNHVSVMDDPLIWGVLPFSFHAYHSHLNHRWGFGSHDICFKGPFRAHFFTLGQVLPTHRSAHSSFGGPLQPTLTEAIRILSPIYSREKPGGPFYSILPWSNPGSKAFTHPPSWPRDPVDPFSELSPTPYYPSRVGDDRNYLAPSRFACNTLGWVHIFPEGMIHQSPNYDMRYFKWGVARLILEPESCPDVVPIWIEGTDQVMHESRGFPRFLPRCFKTVSVTFGAPVDVEARFGDLRARWQRIKETTFLDGGEFAPEISEHHALVEHALRGVPSRNQHMHERLGIFELWEETAFRVREEVLKLRKARGWPDEDPKASAAATWRKEGPKLTGKMKDGTWVGDP